MKYMSSQAKALKIFNRVFWIIVTIIFLNEAYLFFEPKIIGLFKDKNLVSNSDIVNELAECATTYFDVINYKQYDKANMINAYLNKKQISEYDKIYEKINTESAYKIIVKYAYKLTGETYRCYIMVQDLSKDNQAFIANNDKSSMHEIVIKLNLKNTSFKVLYDRFK